MDTALPQLINGKTRPTARQQEAAQVASAGKAAEALRSGRKLFQVVNSWSECCGSLPNVSTPPKEDPSEHLMFNIMFGRIPVTAQPIGRERGRVIGNVSPTALHMIVHAALLVSSSAAFVHAPSRALHRDLHRPLADPLGAPAERAGLVRPTGARGIRHAALRLRGGLAAASVLASEEPFGGDKGSTVREYSASGAVASEADSGSAAAAALGERAMLAVRATFLPAGYPASVPREYARYQAGPDASTPRTCAHSSQRAVLRICTA